jgi:hypothetical protein
MITVSAFDPYRLHLGSGLAPTPHSKTASLHTRFQGPGCRNSRLCLSPVASPHQNSIACGISEDPGGRLRRFQQSGVEKEELWVSELVGES